MMKGLKKWRLFSLLAALTVFLAGCGQEELSTLLPAGEVGKDQFNLLMLSSAIMLLVIIVVVIIYVISLVRFRRSKLGEDHIPHRVHEARLAGAGRAGDEEVGHLGEVRDDVAAADVLADADRHRVRAAARSASGARRRA